MPSPCSRPLMSWPDSRTLSFQSSTQEIGEELINGVIYSISLRKVQLHPGATKGQRWLGVSMERTPGGWPWQLLFRVFCLRVSVPLTTLG